MSKKFILYEWKKVMLSFVVFIIVIPTLYAQNLTVTGQVTDNNGPMTGVTVMQKGTSGGTTSNSAGHFKINVSGSDAVLQFSYIGYTTSVRSFSNQCSHGG
jgi:hypothetical protein